MRLDFPASPDEMVNWKPWASLARATAEEDLNLLRQSLGQNPRPADVRQYLHLRHLVKRLATLASAQPEHWVVDKVEKGYQFDPVRVGRYTEAALFMRIPNILLISATLRPKTGSASCR